MNIVFSHKGKEIANMNLNNRILEEIAGVAPGFDRLITIDGIIVSRQLRYKNVADMFDYACSGDKFVINGFAKDFV